MINNIIHIPKREDSNYISDNTWSIYEETYKENVKAYNRSKQIGESKEYINLNISAASLLQKAKDEMMLKINNFVFDIKNEDEIFYMYEKILNLRYSFFHENTHKVISQLCNIYIKTYFCKYSLSKIEDNVNEFFKNGKLDNFHKILLLYFSKIVNNSQWFSKEFNQSLSKYTDLLKSNLNALNPDKEYEFIKYLIYINKIIEHIDDENKNIQMLDKGGINRILLENLSDSFVKILIYLIDKKGPTFFSELANKPYYSNIFKNKCYAKYFINKNIIELFSKFYSVINTKLENEKYKENKFSEDIYSLIKIYNTCVDSLNFLGSEILDNFKWNNDVLSLNTNYLCASMYYWLNKKNISKIYEIVKFYYKHMPNKLDFLVLMKVNIKKRAENNLCYEFENKVYEYILDVFKHEMYKKNIDSIKNLIEDIYLSEHINDELSKLELIFEDKEKLVKKDKMGNNFDMQKLKTFISSNLHWNENNEIKFNKNISLPDDLSIYNTIIENYYKSKYDNRNLQISYSSSFIDISIKNLDIRMPITYYVVFKEIGNNDNCDLNLIEKGTNIEIDEIIKIINVLKINNLIIENNDKFKFNNNLFNDSLEKVKLNLMHLSKYNDDKSTNSEISYDKDMILDSVIMRTCKNNSPITFNRMLPNIRNLVNKFFIPDDLSIKRRLNRLQEMEYLTFNKDEKMYYYIP